MNIIIKITNPIIPVINIDFEALKLNIEDWVKMDIFEKKDILKVFCKEFLSMNYLGIEEYFEVFDEHDFISFNKQSF